MMGLDNDIILKEIISDLTFQPVIFSLGKLHIMIHTIGVSKRKDWNWAGPGYTTSLVYGKNNLLYLQGFENDKCYIQTYTDEGLLNTVYGKDPNDVWKNFNVLKNYNEIQLYGLEESLTNKLLQHARQLACLSNEWSNKGKMKQLFDFHLRKRTTSNIDWYSIFCDWQKSTNLIIELYYILANIYPINRTGHFSYRS